MSNTIAKYAASPIAGGYETLKEEFQKAKGFKEKIPPESSGPKPSGSAYLVLAGAVVTLLAPRRLPAV
ncbi:MAG: hypothetical protein LBS68_01030 [Puniceicoccales bacterium]|jgi:hypothetical protein|nr:hypothetical protein [Puniceicoccales bacterium]